MHVDLDARRVLVLLDSGPGWSRGILRGFMAAAHERGWVPLHFHPYYPPLDLDCQPYYPPLDLDWLVRTFAPAAAVIGPELLGKSLVPLASAAIVSVAVDRSSEGIASICLDEGAIAGAALEHFLAKGVRHVTTFRFANWRFAREREQAFVERARAAGANVPAGWGCDEVRPARAGEDPAALVEWLRSLPKPCGIFTCSDGWARIVVRNSRLAGLRIPEDVLLVGADNDAVECELLAPRLSSVMVPWQEIGKSAARLVQQAFSGHAIQGERLVISPVGVQTRRSSDIWAIDDVLVAKALRWIREHAHQRLSVPLVARAVGGGRQRLERRFRRALDRTVVEEIRRARVEAAKELLQTTHADLNEVAKRSGFGNAGLLNIAFRRELGIPPGVYRRRAHGMQARSTDE
jgi:LacI family transcriptional regulator